MLDRLIAQQRRAMVVLDGLIDQALHINLLLRDLLTRLLRQVVLIEMPLLPVAGRVHLLTSWTDMQIRVLIRDSSMVQ